MTKPARLRCKLFDFSLTFFNQHPFLPIPLISCSLSSCSRESTLLLLQFLPHPLHYRPRHVVPAGSSQMEQRGEESLSKDGRPLDRHPTVGRLFFRPGLCCSPLVPPVFPVPPPHTCLFPPLTPSSLTLPLLSSCFPSCQTHRSAQPFNKTKATEVQQKKGERKWEN